jgi:Uma2 family endonuclease
MALKTLITPEEYLRTSFEGLDREYVDSEIVERNGGEQPHSRTQARLVEIVYELRKAKPVYALPELRLKLSETRYRIPDVSIFVGQEPAENVPSNPPLIVVEIVSREDRYTKIVEKLDEYHAWGVPHIWLVDPWQRKLSNYGPEGLTAVSVLDVPELGLTVSPPDLFD